MELLRLPHKQHIFTHGWGGELETSQIRGGSWDKKPRKEEECVFQQRGDLMTCNLDLSRRFYESAAARSGQPSGTTGTKRKFKVFSDNFISSEK